MLHAIGHGAAIHFVESLKFVNEVATHVVHLDIDFPIEVFKVKSHFAIVWVGCDSEIGWNDRLLFGAVERTVQYILSSDFFFTRASVLYVCGKVNWCFVIFEYIYLAVAF